MRIRIINKSGQCAIDDHRSLRDAVQNMEFDTGDEPHVILTGPASSIELTAGGKRISLGQNSLLILHHRAAHGRLEREIHDIKVTLGKIWYWIDAKVGRGEPIDDNVGNCVVGIRG